MFKMTFAVIVAMTSMVIFSSAEPYVTDGLVSHWTFDNSDVVGQTVKDIVGDKNGTLMGDAKIVSGRIGEGLELDGDGDFMEVNSDPVFDFGTDDFTIEVWVKVEEVTRYPIVFRGQWGNPAYAYELTLRKGDPYKGCFARMYAVQPMYVVCSPEEDKTAYLSDSLWHHLAFVRASTSYMYIDGEVVGSTDDLAGVEATSDQNLLIGKDPDPNYLRGMIDELRLYKKALRQDEVRENFLQSEPAAVTFANKLSISWGEVKALK